MSEFPKYGEKRYFNFSYRITGSSGKNFNLYRPINVLATPIILVVCVVKLMMAFSAPSLTRICVIKIVKDIKKFCYGLRFDDLGKFKFIVGPFDNLCEGPHTHVHVRTHTHIHSLSAHTPMNTVDLTHRLHIYIVTDTKSPHLCTHTRTQIIILWYVHYRKTNLKRPPNICDTLELKQFSDL